MILKEPKKDPELNVSKTPPLRSAFVRSSAEALLFIYSLIPMASISESGTTDFSTKDAIELANVVTSEQGSGVGGIRRSVALYG